MNTKQESFILAECEKMTKTLNKIKGTNDKKIELKKYEHLHPLIKRIWDPNTTTGITKKSIEDFVKKGKRFSDYANQISKAVPAVDLYNIFDALCDRVISGDTARAAVVAFIEKYPDHEQTIKQIFEKNLRMRIGAKTIQDVWPEMFKMFKVTLAEDFSEDVFNRLMMNFKNTEPPAFISDKIDGVRLITFLKGDGSVEFFSRTGSEFTSLTVLRKEFEHLYKSLPQSDRVDWVFDGELVAIDSDGKENFKQTVSEVRKKDIQMPNPRYKLFDLLYENEFYEEKKSRVLSDRFRKLELLLQNHKMKHAEILTQTPYSDGEFKRLIKAAVGKEGLMIRFNTIYEAKRTKHILKYKFFQTEEFVVTDIEIKKMPFPNKSGGEDFIDALNSVIILYKNCKVWVGSGFSTEERLKYFKNPELILGKTISVQFQEAFYDKEKNTWSLRIPIFKALIGQKRDF